MDQTIEHAIHYARVIFADDSSGHDFSHTMRVFRMATLLAEKESADLFIVQLAALLHDVDDIKLFPETARDKKNAVSFMQKHAVPEKIIQSVCKIIEEIAYLSDDSVIPSTLEGKCVQDADRLDALGAIGIARAFGYGGRHNRVMHDPDIPPKLHMTEQEYRSANSTTINHFYEKLFQLKKAMNTKTAKAIAIERERFMKEYVKEFLIEWDLKDTEQGGQPFEY